MGHGYWREDDFRRYSTERGRSVRADGTVDTSSFHGNAQAMFTQRTLDPVLDPLNVMRECCETEEHPNTLPVILALDVTGSMGHSAIEAAAKLNQVMKQVYEMNMDVEFMVMGIGDLAYDRAPIQISQFESDIRIAEQLDKIYFEGGGGGNLFESYTAAWYMAARHTKLDCWKRGRKGILITLGDEPLNPYLPGKRLADLTGDGVQGDVDTNDLYQEVTQKYDVYHIYVQHGRRLYEGASRRAFLKVLDSQHYLTAEVEEIAAKIIAIVKGKREEDQAEKKTGFFTGKRLFGRRKIGFAVAPADNAPKPGAGAEKPCYDFGS